MIRLSSGIKSQGLVRDRVVDFDGNVKVIIWYQEPRFFLEFLVVDLFKVTPKVSHLYAMKRIFRYLKGQPQLGLWYPRDLPFDLEVFLDSDYARASLDRKSTTGAGSESRPPMLNKENYVPWSSRLLRYAKSDTNRDVPVNETFHVQTDDELTEKELKHIEKEVDELKAERLAKIQDPLTLIANSNNPYAFLAPYQDQPSFNQNYMQQPIPNPEDITDPTTPMNMALTLMAKAFKLNYSTPTNNKQRISSNPRNRQIAQPGNLTGYNDVQNIRKQVIQNAVQNPRAQNVRNQNGLIGAPGNGNQKGNGNLVAARAEGNAAGQNRNQIRCYNCRRVDLDEIEEVNANCILMVNLQQASTSGTQSDKAPVYDSDGSAELHDYENCDDIEIFNMFTQEEQYTELLEPIPDQHQVPHNDNNVIYETVHMIMPSKDNLYNGRKGIGFENPSYFEKAKDLRPTLYDEKVIGLGSIDHIDKSHEDPHSGHNKDIVVEDSMNHMDKNYSFHCSPVPTHNEAGTEADNHNQIENHFHMNHTSNSRMWGIEGDITPYKLMNKRKPNIKFFRVFGCRCYLLNDYEDVGKLKVKGDIRVFVGYSKESAAFRIYNKRTRKIHESVNVNFDEISDMASKQFRLEPGLSNLNETEKSSNQSVSEASKKDLEDLFQDFMMIPTPMVEQAKLKLDLVGKPVDHTDYRSMIGSLMYVTSSRLDIMFATCMCARYQANPNEHHVSAIKRIFRYLKWTINLGLWYPKDSGFDLTAYSDADHAGCHLDRKTESEYVVVSSCCAQVLWMRTQLTDYGFFYDKVPTYCDSKSAITISCNPVQHTRTKHIDVRYHFIKDHVEKGTIELYFVGTEYQLADLFTKSLHEARFKFLVDKLGMMSRET
nr:hypothetical protein [Tanacetum cinerariifolium]